MKKTTAPQPGPGNAWRRMRFEAIALAAVIILVGMALLLLSVLQYHSFAFNVMGFILVFVGAFVLAVRPWNYLRRMEMQALSYQSSLAPSRNLHAHRGHMDARWHHEGEDGLSPGICESCGMLRDEQGKCRRCDEEKVRDR